MRQFRLTDEQRTAIRERFGTTRTEELAAELGMNYYTLQRAAVSMGLKKSDDFRDAMSTIARGKAARIYIGKTTFFKRGSDEAKERDEWMRQHWATTPDEVCAAWFNVNPRTIRRWANRLRLRKDYDTSEMRRRIGRMASPEDYFYRVAYTLSNLHTLTQRQIAADLGVGKNYISNIVKRFKTKINDKDQHDQD